jgi:bifunctional DNase/RNase
MIKDSELVQLSFDKIMQTKAYTVVVLGSKEKKFAIYVDPSIGKTMQLYLTEQKSLRPLTHDLFNLTLKGFTIKPTQVVITAIEETVYYARLFLEQQVGDIRHIVEIDCRPSDALTIAILNDIPVYCTKEVLEESVVLED